MVLLLLFTYSTVFVQCTIGYRINFDNHRSNDRGLLEELFQEHQDDPASIRSPRQTRFSSSSGNNFNQIQQFGNSRPNNGGFDWYGNANNFNRNTQRPSRQSDFVFVDEDDDLNDVVVPNIPRTTTQRTFGSTIAIPGMGTTRSACEDTCLATMQFDPVCGDNNVTYTNIYWLRCAQRCGRNVNVKHTGACPRF